MFVVLRATENAVSCTGLRSLVMIGRKRLAMLKMGMKFLLNINYKGSFGKICCKYRFDTMGREWAKKHLFQYTPIFSLISKPMHTDLTYEHQNVNNIKDAQRWWVGL